MNIKEMEDLDKYINKIRNDYKLDNIDTEELDSIIARTVKDIGFICKVTKNNLIKSFGENK